MRPTAVLGQKTVFSYELTLNHYTCTDSDFQLSPIQFTIITDVPLQPAKIQLFRPNEVHSPYFYCLNSVFETLILNHRMLEKNK